MRRFEKFLVYRNDKGKQYYRNPVYPEIAPSDDDIYVITTGGDRFDRLALQFYSKPDYWWIIASANPEYSGDLNIKPGTQIRIPAKPEKYIKEFERINI